MSPARSPRLRRLGALGALLLLISLAACGPRGGREAEREVADLVSDFPSALVREPTRRLQLGAPEARPFLIRGWRFGTDPESPVPAVWSTADAAELEFYVAAPEDLQVAFRCAPVRLAAWAHREVELSVNGRSWTRQGLAPGMKEYTLGLPGELLHRGINRLVITHPPVTALAAEGKSDLRIRWDRIELTPPEPQEVVRPFAREDRDSLFLPFGTRVDYYLDLLPGSALVVEDARTRGDPGGRLEVTWTDTEGRTDLLSEDFSASPDQRLEIGDGSPGTGRLSLAAVGSGPARSAGIVLIAPRVRAGALPSEELEPVDPRGREEEGSRRTAPGDAPNVIVYLIDTLRADHLGCYGYPLPTSPRIDRFAASATLFANAQAQSPWTRASVASIFTGLWPQQHRANDDEDTLAEAAVTLAELFGDAGYATAAITGNSNASQFFGFGQGFDHFKYLRHLRPDEPLARSTDIHEAVLAWLDARPPDRPFFLFVHTIDPHAPYEPPAELRSRFSAGDLPDDFGSTENIQRLVQQGDDVPAETVARMKALYDAEIAANDRSFGLLLDELERRGLLADALLLVTSDHGEEFHDHGGWTHGKTLYTEMLDVPLIVKLPGQASGRRVEEVVSHVDLLPTIADVVGLPAPDGLPGRSFLPLLQGGDADGWHDWTLSHVDLRGRKATSYVDSSWKLIQSREDRFFGFPSLFDRRQDRLEQRDLAPHRPELARYLASRMKAREEAAGEGLEGGRVSAADQEEVEAELRALGYVD